MSACGPRRDSTSGPVRPVFVNQHSRPLRGRRHKTSSGAASLGCLARSREIKAGQTSRGSRDVSHDDQDQAGASTRSILVASLVLRRHAHARSTEASSKGFHINATRPRPVGRQDGGHHGAQDGVTTRAFGRRRPPFVRITCTSCPLPKLGVVGSLPAQYLGRGPGPL